MKRNSRNLNMKGKSLLVSLEDNDLSNMPDSEISSTSSSNQILEKNETLVMELHGMNRDELPDNPLPEVKTRKLLRKKRPRPDQDSQDQSAGSLTSSSDGSVVPPGPEKQEEFFDAHESYYDFPENQVSTTAVAPRTVTSKHLNPEIKPPTTQSQGNLEIKELAVPPIITDATTAAVVTQDAATGQTPLTSAKPIQSRHRE